MVLFRITENEPSKMLNVRPYVYSRPWFNVNPKALFTNGGEIDLLLGMDVCNYINNQGYQKISMHAV